MASDQKVAVVTGAAGGLGACFARKLAELDYELILIDRREDDVNRLCGELRSISNTKVEPIAADLCDNEAVAELARRLAALPHIELLINNAGFGFSQDFVDVEIQRHIDMIALHVMTPASLTHAVLPRMIERNRGAIINVSSLGAWTPSAGSVQYCSTKAYLVSFSESLQDELRGTKLRVQALCPGFIHTGFHDRDGMSHLDIGKIPKWLWVTTDEAVKCSLQNLSRRQVIVIPGFLPRILGRCMRMPMLQPLVRALSRQPRRDDKNAATR
jgi:short-subunit dehydrogenase